MRRRQLFVPLTPLVALTVALATAGCGVPGRTSVVVDGEAQRDPVQDTSGTQGLPPGPEGTADNIEEFVKRFLEAPAGDWEGAADRVKEFLSPQEAARWQAPREITVVRLVSGRPEIKPGSVSQVVLNVQQVGVLTNRGTLDPPTAPNTTYTFTVAQTTAPRGGLAVENPPPGVMLLTDTGLDRWYLQRRIYFWDIARRNLVPDLRYLPRAEDEDGRPNLLIGWLLGGPAGWLRPSVLELPDGTKQLGNAYRDNEGRLVVHLSNAATTGQNPDQLLAQLCWSLREDFTGELVLQIESVKRGEGSASDHLDRNPGYRLSNDQGQQPFAVAGGVVRRIKIDGVPVSADVPLDPEVNKNVRYAAISDAYAALVRKEGDQLRLWAGPRGQGHLGSTKLRAASMSRPVLAGGQEAGYVAADGKLYQFASDPAKVAEVNVSGLSGPVTSIALAPDGRRLAVVAGGKPYLVALSGDGGASTGAARPVPAPLRDVTGITWLNETSVAMTGTGNGRVPLVKITLDGAVLLSDQQDLNVTAVTELVAFPEDPVSGIGSRIMIEADDRAYEVYSSQVTYLRPEKLAGPPPPKGVVLTAPFFLE